MFDLEHLILFGLPENKLEWFDSRSHCRLPSASRTEAEAAFLRCAESLARWQGLDGSASIARRGDHWRATAGGIRLELVARVIEASIPIYPDAIHEFQERFWQPSLWPRDETAPAGGGSGFWQWSETRMNIVIYLMGITDHSRNGWSSGRVDVVLSDMAIMTPDAFYYRPERQGCLVDRDYFVGPPDLIIEILTPATAAWTRGFRADLYRRAGVRHFWVAVPETNTLEIWTLQAGQYQQTGSYVVGQLFRHPLFPDLEIDAKEMLQSRWGRDHSFKASSEREPTDQADLNRPIPLQNLLLAGHPDRRYEVIDGRSTCIVAFGSEAVADQRFRDWAVEIERWDGVAVTESERVRTRRFDLRRDGKRVTLHVDVEYATCEEILRVYNDNSIWQDYNQAVDSVPE